MKKTQLHSEYSNVFTGFVPFFSVLGFHANKICQAENEFPNRENELTKTQYLCLRSNSRVNHSFNIPKDISEPLIQSKKKRVEADACVTQEDKHNQRCMVCWEDRWGSTSGCGRWAHRPRPRSARHSCGTLSLRGTPPPLGCLPL